MSEGNTMVTCSNCGGAAVELTEAGGEAYCSQCHDEKFVKCIECDEWIERAEAIRLSSSHRDECICGSCDDEYTTCDHCDTRVRYDATYSVGGAGGETWCQECHDNDSSTCHSCEGLFSDDDGENIYGRFYCVRFRDERFELCERCQEWAERDYIVYAVVDNCTYCEGCHNDIFTVCSNCGQEVRHEDANDAGECSECSPLGIHSYNYKPRAEFHGEGPLFLGWELEIEDKGDVGLYSVVSYAEESALPLYLKNDGSLNDGVEIVSHPGSLDYWTKHGQAIDDLLGNLSSEGFRSHNTTTCGLHVHISRNALTSLDIYKLQKLVYENALEVKRLSRRSLHQLDHWCKLFGKANAKTMARAAKRYVEGRYDAVNLTNHSTVELRFFRGTLNRTSFKATLEFADAAVRYVKQVGISGVSWDTFRSFVSENQPRYNNLAERILLNTESAEEVAGTV